MISKLYALLILLVGLSGCQFFDPIETLDQLGHYGAGQLIACDAAKWVSPEAAVAHTMAFAKTREELQHPGQCREGCQRDLATWQRGAEHGATCAVSSRTKEAL